MKYCKDLDTDFPIGDNTDGKYKIINDKYIMDFKYEKVGDKEEFIVFVDDYEYTTSKIYLFHRILINNIIGEKGYKKIIFRTNYINLDMQLDKVFDTVIDYPQEIMMAGEFCKDCIKRKYCLEVKNGFVGDVALGELKNDAQILNTLNLVSNRIKMLETAEEQLKAKLYDRIKESNNELVLPELGVKLSRNEITKDTISYTEANKIEGIVNDLTVNMKVGEIKKIIKSDKIIASKIKFTSAPWKVQLEIKSSAKIPKLF